MPGDGSLSIGEVCELTGATRRTVQYYDRIGLVPAVRDSGDRRRYCTADVTRLQYVQVLASLDVPLDRISALLAGRVDDLLLLRHQQAVLEQEELRLRTRSTVVGAIVRALEVAPGARITSGILPALLGTETALLEHGGDTTDAGQHHDDVAFIVEVYLRWKAVSVEALVLHENEVAPGSPAGLDVGARWHAFLELATQGRVDGEVFAEGREDASSWPEADQQLLARTEQYVTACHAAWAEEHGPASPGA